METVTVLQGVQDKTLEILVYLDEVCRQQNLTYYLAYGTLLGAIRHKGFIPWDDDVDIWMPRKDYMLLLEYLRQKGEEGRFVINEGKYKPKGDRPSELQMRILDTQTQIQRGYANTTITAYAWIDIFALDTFPDKKQKRYLKTFKKKLFWYKIARCKTFLIDNGSLYGKMNKLIYFLHNKWGWFKRTLSEEKKLQKTVDAITKYCGKNGEDFTQYFCYAAVYLPKQEKCFFKREWFTPVEVEFCGKKFFAPQGYHEVLTKIYNDYMTLPPESERVTHGVKEA